MPVAPRWHTAVLVGLYVAVAVTGALAQRSGVSPSALPVHGGRIARVYAPLLLTQGGLAVYVVRVGRPRSALGALVGARWNSARRAGEDLALAAAGWGVLTAVELLYARFAGHGTPASVVAMLPDTALERLAWVLIAAGVGVCEEIVFRGYFQAQFEAFWHRGGLAVALQAALFGLAHGEQGVAAAARAAVYGLGLGALARWRRSLVPGIVCHVWTDLASGLFRI